MESLNLRARSSDAGDARDLGVGTNDQEGRGVRAAEALVRLRCGRLRGAGAVRGPDAPGVGGVGRVSELLAGLDIGTSAVKGIAIDRDGRVVAIEEASYPLSTPRPGWAEQDPQDWWVATQAVLDALRAKAGPPSAIGLSGQMHGLVALDAEGRVLRPAILWNDQRTGAECAEIERLIGLERLISLTGNRALPGFTAPKLLWLRRHEPDVYARIARIMLPKDYVRLRLCGAFATDVSDASGTLLLDVAGRRWSEEVLEELEIDPAILPAVLESPQQLRRDQGRRAGRGGRRRSGRGRARRGSRPAGPGVGGARHLRRRVRSAARLRRRSAGARARVLPRRPRRLACDGRDALRRGSAALAAQRDRTRRGLRRAGRAGRDVACGRRGAALPALPRGRAHPARRPRRPRRVRRAGAAARPRAPWCAP